MNRKKTIKSPRLSREIQNRMKALTSFVVHIKLKPIPCLLFFVFLFAHCFFRGNFFFLLVLLLFFLAPFPIKLSHQKVHSVANTQTTKTTT